MEVDLSTVPLIAVSLMTKEIIANMLNPPMYLPTDDGLPRDWRGFAHLLDINGTKMPLLCSNSDPTMQILTMLEKDKKYITIKDFQVMMEQIDRTDIIDDTEELFECDAAKYLEHQQKAQESAVPMNKDSDQEILTSDDIYRLRQGLGTMYYDAFLLYAEEDVSFADEIVEKLEMQHNLKLCLQNRDLVVFGELEHEAIMKLISERCNRLISVISPNFFQSTANKFFFGFTQALSIEMKQRKIIPIIYKSCELPYQLRYLSKLDYNIRRHHDFWSKLRDTILGGSTTARSIMPVPESSKTTQVAQSSMKQEIPEVKNILPDKHMDVPKSGQKTIGILKDPQCSEIRAISTIKDTKALNDRKKDKKLFQWDKFTASWKMKESKPNSGYKQVKTELTTGEISQKLPLVNNLDDLNSSNITDTSNITDVYEEKKKNRFVRFRKKKVAMKS